MTFHLFLHASFLFPINLISSSVDLIIFVRIYLTHYSPVLLSYAPWKHQKTFRLSDVSRGYRKATLGCNGSTFYHFIVIYYSTDFKVHPIPERFFLKEPVKFWWGRMFSFFKVYAFKLFLFRYYFLRWQLLLTLIIFSDSCVSCKILGDFLHYRHEFWCLIMASTKLM